MTPTRRLVVSFIVSVTILFCLGSPLPAQTNPAPGSAAVDASAVAGQNAAPQEYSHVRIVRLSFIEGSVAVQKPGIAEWATAHINTPLQEGFKLSTAEGGYVEAEFENASTARFGQLSLVEFTRLALAPSGGKLNSLTLYQGYGTLNVVPEGDDYYEVKAGSATLVPRGKTRFRVDLDQGFVQVKVFKGTVQFGSPEGNGTLAKNTALLIRPEGTRRLEVTQGLSKDAWDEWVEQREEIAQAARNRPAPSTFSAGFSDLTFGFTDLMFYGNWYSNPTYGYVWYPFANPGWGPFVTGQWAFYPGFGYVWISGEPWGWLPYHYGSWVYMPGMGWGWCPGGYPGWYPATVNWYQGPGWVGWAPRPPRGGVGQARCPPQGCIIAVGEDHFRSGRPVGPNRFSGEAMLVLARGRAVVRPDLPPERGALLPGSSRPQPATPGIGNVSAARSGTAASVPQSGGAPTLRSPVAGSIPVAAGNATQLGGTVGRPGRPGPRANYPVPADTDAQSRLGARQAPWGIERGSARSTRDYDTTSDRVWGSSGRSGRSSSRSGSAASDRSGSSGRASDRGSSSSGRGSMSSGSGRSGGGSSGGGGSRVGSGGGGSSGGGRSSSSSSGGGGHSTGGSSGGGHSSGGSSSTGSKH